MGKDNTGQNDHTALQADGGVAFDKSHADAAGGLPRETGQGDGRDGRRHIEFEKAGIDGQNHDQRQNPDKQGSQERYRPQRDTLQKAHVLDDGHHLVWQGRVGHGREAGGVHNGGHRALGDAEQGHHQLQAVGDGPLRQREPHKGLDRHLRALEFCEVPLENTKQIPSYPKIQGYA